MSDRVTDIAIAIWILASGAAFVLLTIGVLPNEAAKEVVAAGRGLYAIAVAVLVLVTALRLVRRLNRRSGQ